MPEETIEVKPKKKQVKIHARVVHSKGQTDLVEWVENGEAKRGYIPKTETWEGEIDKDILDAATPYGIPFEKYLEIPKVTAGDIIRSLHNNGIWTSEDLIKHQREALGAIQAVYLVTLAALNEAANNYRMEGE
jgi:hypothetical protein